MDTFLIADQIQIITMRENRLRALMPFSNLRELRELYLNNNFINDTKEIPVRLFFARINYFSNLCILR